MMLGRLGLVVAAALSLCACTASTAGAVESTGQPPGSAVEQIDVAGDLVVLNGTKSLILASNAYQGAAAAITPLVRAGVFSQAQLERIRVLNEKAFNALELGRKGVNTAARAAEVFDVVTELDDLSGVPRQ